MVTWGVLRLPVAPGPDRVASAGAVGGVGGEGALAAGLAAHLDGALAITGDAPLSDVLTVLPADVARLVELDATQAEDAGTLAVVARLLAEAEAADLGRPDEADDASPAFAAVVSARPMADALKRVEGDVVVEGVARDGLMIPCLPFVIDRAALVAAAAAAQAVGENGQTPDAIGLLLAAGHAVRVVPVDGEPHTLHTAPSTVHASSHGEGDA